jgi:post-segregation antitoxin (ccd killing protein)
MHRKTAVAATDPLFEDLRNGHLARPRALSLACRRRVDGGIFGGMPKMQVYLPADLHARVRSRSDRLNVSNVVQRALEHELAELDRRDALDKAVSDYEAKHGRFTPAELRAREANDKARARRPRAAQRKSRAA